MRRTLAALGAWAVMVATCATGSADSITLVSDTNTLAAAVGVGGIPTSGDEMILDSGDTTGLAFGAAVAGSFTFTTPPAGSPVGTETIAIPPDDLNNGQNGFFEVQFTLPAGFFNPWLTGAGNVDDGGTVFLNGTAITPVNYLNEGGDNAFFTTQASLFQVGTNTLLISDSNTGGGPSGAAFYAIVNFNGAAVPEPSGVALLGLGVTSIMLYVRRRASGSR